MPQNAAEVVLEFGDRIPDGGVGLWARSIWAGRHYEGMSWETEPHYNLPAQNTR